MRSTLLMSTYRELGFRASNIKVVTGPKILICEIQAIALIENWPNRVDEWAIFRQLRARPEGGLTCGVESKGPTAGWLQADRARFRR